MLYVFHVDVGRMMNFDMNVAMSNVEILKETIERLHGIPAANIVLLVSGGETLQHSHQVSSYSAGTDTNPIYMFIKGDVRLQLPLAMGTHIENDLDLRDQVERCLELPATYETVVTRAHLAARMHEMARDEERLSFRLVHEQHLQQQGWYAAVANLEDVTNEFKQRVEWVCGIFDAHFARRNQSLDLLGNFGQDVTKLAQIPILPGLMPLAERDFLGFDALLEQNDAFKGPELEPGKNLSTTLEVDNESSTSSTSPNKKPKMGTTTAVAEAAGANIETETTTTTTTTILTTTVTKITTTTTKTDDANTTNITPSSSTGSLKRQRNFNLLQWITTKENHSKLKLMSDETIQALGIFNVQIYEQLKTEAQNIIHLGQQTEIKEIKGLSDRLCKLEEFKYRIKDMVNDQKELSTAFQHNQNRANKLRDPTILPDLCASHQSQMQVMLQNHQKIREHRKLIARAKEELGSNLNTRLKRIIWIHNAMCAFDSRLLFYFRYMRRADRHIFIIRQINQAPDMYAAAVAETVRRKIFSTQFCAWATKLVRDFEVIRGDEVKRRNEFNMKFAGHFLNILFPGMNEMPPTFTNEETVKFDKRLPNLTTADIDLLTSEVPELATHILLPDMRPVINFFASRSGEFKQHLLTDAKAIEQAKVVTTSEKQTGCDISTQLEKTTPTTTMTRSTTTEPLPLTISAATCTEQKDFELTESEKSAQKEVARLRSILNDMSKVAFHCITVSREQMSTIREQTTNLSEQTKSELQLLQEQCTLLKMQAAQRELDMTEMRNKYEASLSESQRQIEQMAEKEERLSAQLLDLQTQLQTSESQVQAAVAEAREQLIHAHKTELEALRCRFKLMTSMDSMSAGAEGLGSTEKRQEAEMLSLSEHELILQELRNNMETEKEKCLSTAVETERAMWQAKLSVLSPEAVMANVTVLREMLEEKEKQLEMLRERDLMQTKENYQLKTRLDALTNEECNSWMKEKIEFLNRDKVRLEEELNMERSRRAEMETSVAAVRSSSTSGMAAAKPYVHSRCISLESCNKGDIVFVVWNMRHGQFTVVQDSSSLYFVHGDSLSALNLHLPTAADLPANLTNSPTIPLPFYAIGRVFDKEYCAARKDENRYRVSKGSRFYRIKLSPLSTKGSSSRRDRMDSSSVSRSISQSESAPIESVSGENAIGIRPSCSTAVMSTTMTSTAAQTAAGTSTSMMSKDMTDCAGSLSPSASSTTLTATSVYKERTISVTSVITDDGDEPLSMLSDGGGGGGGGGGTMRCRYLSVNEEDEYCSPSETTTVNIQHQQQQQQSVITEQPTATISHSRLEMLVNSAVLPQIINNNNNNNNPQQQQQQQHELQIDETTITTQPTETLTENQPSDEQIKELDEGTQIQQQQQQHQSILDNSNASPVHQSSIGATLSIATTSEDSDEYRSLEPKEFDDEQETEFTSYTAE